MPLDQWQAIKAVAGITLISLGTWVCIRSHNQRQVILKLDQLTEQAKKCNINQRSLRKEKQSSKQHALEMQGRAACIEKVTAHFLGRDQPNVRFISHQNDNYAKIECSPFWIVEKNFSKSQYQTYKVRVSSTWINKELLIPEQSTFTNTNKQTNRQFSPSILTSACALGIVGTLSLDSTSEYVIEAKIIGQSIDEIEKYIASELLNKGFSMVFGGVLIIVGVGFFINLYREYKRARVPLERSLLDF